MKATLTLTTLVFTSCFFCSCTSGTGGTTNTGPADTLQERAGGASGTAAVAAAQNAPAPDSLIVPGAGIGQIRLESDATEIMKKLGKPDAADAAMGKSVATWFDHHDRAGNSVSIFTARAMGNSPEALIKQIRVTAPGFKTAAGIGTNSSLEQIQQVFSVQKKKGYKHQLREISVYADPSGVAFEVDNSGSCIGIVVYPKGELHPDTYGRFVPGISVTN